MRTVPWLLLLISQALFLEGMTTVLLIQPEQEQHFPGLQPLIAAAGFWPALCLAPPDLSCRQQVQGAKKWLHLMALPLFLQPGLLPSCCAGAAVAAAAVYAPAWHPLHTGLTPLSLVQSPPNPHPQCCFLPRTHTPTGGLDWSVISLYAIVKCLSGQDLCQ